MATMIKSRVARAFYDPWESALPQTRLRVIRRRLDDYVRFARQNAPFYRDRLSAFDPKAEFPLARVPILRPDDLREALPPRSERLFSRKTTAYSVFQSGGTTGFPKTTLFTHEELDGLYLPNARGFHALGLSREDRVANLFAVGGLYMTFLHIHRMLEEYGCMNFPFSNHAPVDFMHTVIRLFRVNAVAGIASVVLNALRGMEKLGLKGVRINKIFYGGEHLYEADKREIREKFGAELIAAPGYGTVDSWYIGYQCRDCPTGVFHVHDDQCYLEIVDEETGRAAQPGAVGMAYVTAFVRRLTPVVRYRVGDRARWLAGSCSCGRTTPLFELLGRGDDVLRIGFDSIDYNAIQETVGSVEGLSGTIQMQKERAEGRDRLVVRVETEVPGPRRARLKKMLERELLRRRLNLSKAVKNGSVWPPRLELLDCGRIPRNSRTGKLIRVIDLL